MLIADRIANRILRIAALGRRLAREIDRIEHAGFPLRGGERDAYLEHLRSTVRGLLGTQATLLAIFRRLAGEESAARQGKN